MKKVLAIATNVELDTEELVFLKGLGFKKVWAEDKSCFWMEKKLHNPFIRNGTITIEPGAIIVWGMEPKGITGNGNQEHMIAGLKYTRNNLYLLFEGFLVTKDTKKQVNNLIEW